jgi:iron complex outermembrane receptor protein
MEPKPLGCARASSLKPAFFLSRLFAAVLLLGLTLSASAQTAATGSITGRVLDAASNRYLNNARVSVQGTNESALTDEYGQFRLNDVPAGAQQLLVFYSGLGEQTVPVTVLADQTVTQNVTIGRAGADDAVVLDTFTVNSGRVTDIASIATNEQRFAPNIKTVIETNAFGDISEGNVGEFLKFLPGVTVDYVAADVRTVSVRGFGPGFTSVSVDGFRMASASSGAGQRAFEFEQVSINNASRVEVVKVPVPSMPADALGGAVNMVGKNAFEREGAQFNYRAGLNMSHENLDILEKTPGPGRKRTYKALPGFDFDYTLPVTKNLGFVITGLSSNQFNEQHRTQKNWNFAQAGATQTNPYLQSYVFQDGPKNSFRDSASVKMDWRINDQSSMWVAYQFNYYKSFFGNRNTTLNVGTTATSATTGGAALTWGPDFASGASGRGAVSRGSSHRDKLGATNALMAKYRFNGRDWEFDAGVAYSSSKNWYRDIERGHFNGVNATMQNVSRVELRQINEERPQVIRVLSPTGTELDWANIGQYRLNTVSSTPLDAKDEYATVHANVKRDLELSFPVSIKAGGEVRMQERDITRRSRTWNFVGPDGVLNTADDNAAAFGDPRYGVDPHWGLPTVQWPDPFLLGDLFLTNPGYFTQTTAQQLTTERFRIQNSQLLEETISALYLQADAKFIDNRLAITTGIRYEKTEDEGKGPLTPTAGLTLADVAANWRERELEVSESYDGFYPSLHANFNMTDNLIFRAAWAKALGRPDFANILPLVRVNETDVSQNDGIGNINPRTIIYNNVGLQPWEGSGWDLAVEYYPRNGGLLSFGIFGKEIDGFFGTESGIATAEDVARLGIDPDYVGFATQTQINIAGKARISGWELNFRQPLTFIPKIGENLNFFFNMTQLDLKGQDADFNGFIEESASTGLSYGGEKLTLRANFNFRGRQVMAAQTGAAYGPASAGYRAYFTDRFYLDLNGEYRFSKKFAVFANVRNTLNEPQDIERVNSLTPDYAALWQREEFAVQITVGFKGTF